MNDLVEFLTSQEILFVYLISAIACVICLIVYIVEKNSEVLRRKHNTKELNKLVEEVRERTPEIEVLEFNEPVIQSIEEVVTEEVEEQEEELEYTSIEPDQATARLELEKLKEELIKQEEKERLEKEQLEKEAEVINIDDYESDQEATAIISMEELLEKGKELYASNEATQYKEEYQPISIQDLEKQMARSVTKYDEPFIIEEAVGEEVEESPVIVEVEDVHEEKKFKSSPIISPIFGIEKNAADNSLALENTANYDKLDEQINKQNEFVMTLKEFQKNL